MPSLLIATLDREEVGAHEALTNQLARWKIEGKLDLAFWARGDPEDGDTTFDMVCIRFETRPGASTFEAEFLSSTTDDNAVVPFKTYVQQEVPIIDALNALI